MTHHGRKGGRALELFLLFGLLILSAGLIAGGFFLGAFLLYALGDGGPRVLLVPFLGAGLGMFVAGRIWRFFLRYYRYGTDLKPIRDAELALDPRDTKQL